MKLNAPIYVRMVAGMIYAQIRSACVSWMRPINWMNVERKQNHFYFYFYFFGEMFQLGIQ